MLIPERLETKIAWIILYFERSEVIQMMYELCTTNEMYKKNTKISI